MAFAFSGSALVAQSSVTYREPALAMVVLAAVVLAGSVALWAWFAWSTRPRRAVSRPPSLDPPGAEPPALVGMLVNRFDMPSEAPAATLVDLAARGHLMIENAGGGVLVRLREHAPSDSLTPYEKRVLTHVRGRALNGVVPAGALGTGDDAASKRWFRAFRREVNKDARARGLARRRFGLGVLAALWISVVVAYLAVAAAFATGSDVSAEETSTNVLVPIVLIGNSLYAWWMGRLTRAGLQRDTDAGLHEAGEWEALRAQLETGGFEEAPAASVAIWDRLLAYAIAFGLAPRAARDLSLGEESDRHAWSREGGRWHQVRVWYPRWRPGWGEAPVAALVGGAVQSAVTALLAGVGIAIGTGRVDLQTLDSPTRVWIERAALLAGIALVPVFVFVLTKTLFGLVDLIPRRTVEGTVVRQRALREGHWMPKPLQYLWYSRRDRTTGATAEWQRQTRYWVALDPGDRTMILAHRVRPGVYGSVSQGGRAVLRVSPLLGYVKEARMTSSPPREAPMPPSELAEAFATKAADALDRRLDKVEGYADTTAGGDRPSVLDRTTDDGRTVRAQFDEARRRLETTGYGEPFGGLLDRSEQYLESVADPNTEADQVSGDEGPTDE